MFVDFLAQLDSILVNTKALVHLFIVYNSSSEVTVISAAGVSHVNNRQLPFSDWLSFM